MSVLTRPPWARDSDPNRGFGDGGKEAQDCVSEGESASFAEEPLSQERWGEERAEGELLTVGLKQAGGRFGS